MNPLVFLGIALVVSVLGILVLWSRSRQPNTPDASIAEFNAKLRALSGDGKPPLSGPSDTSRGD